MTQKSNNASPQSLIASLPEPERSQTILRIAPTPKARRELAFKWESWKARTDQIPPDGSSWLVWLLLAGRGFGKTRTGAETVRAEVEAGRARRIALIAPTAADVRKVMVEGESGLLAVHPDWERPVYESSKQLVTWGNGAIAMCYSADEPERLRGPQHDLAWADEIGAWRYMQDAWDMLMFGLRLGDRPRVVVTTTPRPIKLLRELVAAPTTHLTRGSTFDNKENLAPSFLTQIVGKYDGTRLGRQELYAELLEQADGALWTRKMLDAAFIDPAQVPEMRRVVVALDPAVTAGENSDETGIIVAGLGIDGLYYVLRDASGHFSPNEWARRAVNLRIEMDADKIVAEVNNGGDLVQGTLRTIDPTLPFKPLTASKGKRTRADPIAALYEQNRVRHAGGFAELEDQLCNWVPGTGQHSPDRLDALVWALTELVLEAGDTGTLDWMRAQAEAMKEEAA